MSNATIGSLTLIIMFVVIMFTGLNYVASDINGNNNLDSRSQELISELNNEVSTKYQLSEFQAQNDTLVQNNTFLGTDAFVRQYLEDKSDVSRKTSTLKKIVDFPAFILRISGLDTLQLMILVVGLIVVILGLWIFFAGYKAVRTGEVD